MNNFIKFGDVADYRNGLNFGKDSHGAGCLLVGVADFKNNFSPIWESIKEINPCGVVKEDDYLKKGDIIFVRSNGNKELVGRSLFIDRDIDAVFSGFCIRARINSDLVDPLFLAYFTKTSFFKSSISYADGTSINNLNQKILSDVKIPLFPLSIQKDIALFLSNIDKKVNLNIEIINNLEQVAIKLYEYWFVQFDFPDHYNKPYKYSNGKMIYSEKLKKYIPEGWCVSTLSNLIDSDKGGDWGRDNYEGNYNLDVNCIRGTDLEELSTLGNINLPKRFILHKNRHKLLEPHDCVIEISGGSPTQSTGRIGLITNELLARFDSKLICSNFCRAISLKNKKLAYNFLYVWKELYRHKVFFGWEGKTSGIKNLQFELFTNKYHVVIPPDELAERFFNIVNPIEAQKQKLLKENKKLYELKNWLLPMLMNGQISIRDAEGHIAKTFEQNE